MLKKALNDISFLLGFVGLDRKYRFGNGTLGAGAAIRGSVSIVAGPSPAMGRRISQLQILTLIYKL